MPVSQLATALSTSTKKNMMSSQVGGGRIKSLKISVTGYGCKMQV